MNPDGVVLGNYRTGMAGKDLNRIFKSGVDQLISNKQTFFIV